MMTNKILVKSMKNYADFIFYFNFSNSEDANANICSFFEDLGFSKKESAVFDEFYPEYEEGYLFGESNDIKAHLFITKNNINIVLDSKLPREKIIASLKKYFTLPWDK